MSLATTTVGSAGSRRDRNNDERSMHYSGGREFERCHEFHRRFTSDLRTSELFLLLAASRQRQRPTDVIRG